MKRASSPSAEMVYGVIHKDITYPNFHSHRRTEIVLVTEGVLTMQINKEVYDIEPGYAVFIDAYDGHSFRTNESSTCAVIEFQPEFCKEIYAPFYNWISNHTLIDKLIKIPDEIFSCVTYLLPKCHGKRECYDANPSRTFAMLAPLLYAIMSEGKFVSIQKQPRNSFIRIADYVVENYDKPLTRESVASHVGIRPQSLSRIFSKKLQMTFVEYVQYVRITQSLRKLEGGESVAEAAYSSGFESIRTYNRVFKSILGKTPSEYLKSL